MALLYRYGAPGILALCLLRTMWPRNTDKHKLSQWEEARLKSENLSESSKEKYSNFYLEGSQNINLTDFKLIINNDICGDDDIKIVTIVTTALENEVSDKCVYKSSEESIYMIIEM